MVCKPGLVGTSSACSEREVVDNEREVVEVEGGKLVESDKMVNTKNKVWEWWAAASGTGVREGRLRRVAVLHLKWITTTVRSSTFSVR